MRLANALLVLILAGGCGGPPIGEKVPRPDPGAVAVGAAAAAAATTLADPDSAGKQPEAADAKPPEKAKRVKETVPETVLDRAETGPADADLPPCEPAQRDADDERSGDSKATDKKGAPRRLELIPVPARDVPDRGAGPKKNCRVVDEEDEGGDRSAP